LRDRSFVFLGQANLALFSSDPAIVKQSWTAWLYASTEWTAARISTVCGKALRQLPANAENGEQIVRNDLKQPQDEAQGCAEAAQMGVTAYFEPFSNAERRCLSVFQQTVKSSLINRG
jgi:hypothetical protein